MDPATVAVFTGFAEYVARFGVLGVLVVIIVLLLRAWRHGDFVPRSQHEEIVKLVQQRYLDLVERLKEVTAERDQWKLHSERAARAAELSQSEHAGIVSTHNSQNETLREIRADLREALRHSEGRP